LPALYCKRKIDEYCVKPHYSLKRVRRCISNYNTELMMSFKQKKILLVDDDEEEFYIFKLALDLAKIDYHCIWANGLEEATQLIKEQPDFVFIDINMPRYDGINCLRKLKELEGVRHSTFVMYSTYISDDDHDKALELGADHCIHKPENIKVLLKQLMGLFNDKAHHA